jgi:hypothetical protein
MLFIIITVTKKDISQYSRWLGSEPYSEPPNYEPGGLTT